MKRAFVLALTIALVAVVALPVGAAPSNGNSATEFDCGDGVTILVQFNSSSAAVFDVAATDGRRYVLSSLDDRLYFGIHASEPATAPDFAFQKTWGKRAGYSETLTCSGSFVGFDARIPDGDFTEFFDVVLSGK